MFSGIVSPKEVHSNAQKYHGDGCVDELFPLVWGGYYAPLTNEAKAEVADFINHYANQVEHGVAAPGAGDFAYSDDEMNHVLFSPYIAYLRTLADIYADEGDPYVGDDVTLGMIVEYANFGKISTSLADPLATTNHVIAIVESDSPASAVDGELESTGVPTTAVAGDGVFYVSPDPAPAPEQWMADLHNHTVAQVAAFDHEADVQHWLQGTQTNAQMLASDIQQWLVGFVDDPYADAYVLHAAFGSYGAMPYVVTTFTGGYLLTSAVTGTTVGPFHIDDELNPTPLLDELPEFVTGSAFSNVDLANVGVGVVFARIFGPLPAGFNLDTACVPPGCWESRYRCSTVAGGRCQCIAIGWIRNGGGTGPIRRQARIRCTFPPSSPGVCETTTTPPAFIPGADCVQAYEILR